MSEEELQLRYDRLLQKVAKMRRHQREYKKYWATKDKESAHRLEKEVDKIILEEEKRKASQQGQLL